MEAWQRFGNFIGRHMALISPTLVILAVLFPDVFSPLAPLVPFMFAAITFQGALGNDFYTLAEAFKRPQAMIATILVVSVAMPFLAFSLASVIFGSNPNLVAGIVLEYSVPVAVVSTMWISMFDGDSSLGLATLLVSTLLAPISIPLTLRVLLGASVEVDAIGMFSSMLVQVALPALVGTTLNHFTGGWGKKALSPVISPATKFMLLLVILSNSTAAAPYMRHLTPQAIGVIVFIGLYASFGYVLGYLVAKHMHQERDRAVTMTFQCGLRNISAGAVIAAQYFPGEVMLPVIAGTLFQQVLAALTGKFMDRALPRD